MKNFQKQDNYQQVNLSEEIISEPNKKKNIKKIILFVAVFLFLIISGIFFYFYLTKKSNSTSLNGQQITLNDETSQKEKNNTSEINEGDWNTYTHSLLGLEFKYKKEWGDPFIRYFNYLTNLSVMTEQYVEEKLKVNFDDQTLYIGFSNLDYYSTLNISKNIVNNTQYPSLKYSKQIKKLNNGYFDYLSVSQKIQEEINNNDDYEFFINSIKSITPLQDNKTFSEIKDDEDVNISIIKRYYNYIIAQELTQAYDMYLYKKIDFDQYSEWYQFTIVAKPYQFETIGNNEYQFYVDFQDENKKPQTYRITMEVIDGKINTISSEEITSEEISFDNLSAFTKNTRGYNYVVLKKDGEEIIIDKAPDDPLNNISESLFFTGLEFSPNGDYLKYKAFGWEWVIGRVYDINNNQQSLDLLSMAQNGFTNDEKYFYSCANNMMSGDSYVLIYSVPDFKMIKSGNDFGIFDEFFFNLDCQLLPDENILEIVTSDFASEYENKDSKKTVIYEYSFDNQALISKKEDSL